MFSPNFTLLQIVDMFQCNAAWISDVEKKTMKNEKCKHFSSVDFFLFLGIIHFNTLHSRNKSHLFNIPKETKP